MTMLFPFLFPLCIVVCKSQHTNTPIVNRSDDTGLTGLITDDGDSHYRQQIRSSVDWCDEDHLQCKDEVNNCLF